MPYASMTIAALIQCYQWYGYTYHCDGDTQRVQAVDYYQ